MRKDGRQVILAPVSSHSLCYRELEASWKVREMTSSC